MGEKGVEPSGLAGTVGSGSAGSVGGVSASSLLGMTDSSVTKRVPQTSRGGSSGGSPPPPPPEEPSLGDKAGEVIADIVDPAGVRKIFGI